MSVICTTTVWYGGGTATLKVLKPIMHHAFTTVSEEFFAE